jgi:glutamate-ammonia-ligase adenylyltransferase
MERQLAKESYARLNLKVGRGGLADIDFLLQLVQIREGAVHPEFRQLGTRQLLAALPSTRYITASEVDDLREAHRMLRTLETLIRLEMDSAVSWIEPDQARLDPVARRMGCAEPAGQRLLARYRDLTDRVRTIYSAVLVRLGGR